MRALDRASWALRRRRAFALSERAHGLVSLESAELRGCVDRLRRAAEERGRLPGTMREEALALGAAAIARVHGIELYPPQLAGAEALLDGVVVEMKTGEGKTFTAVVAAFVRSLEGKGAHVLTVNDYLAQRDAEIATAAMAPLGVRVLPIVAGSNAMERRASYGADITYACHRQVGFDYLRDHLRRSAADCVMRGLHAAIVDEADQILIDGLKTPMVVSGPDDRPEPPHDLLALAVERLRPEEHFEVDLRARTVSLTEEGMREVEEELAELGLLTEGGLYEVDQSGLVSALDNALTARAVMQRGEDYVVRDDRVELLDRSTGRIEAGRKWGRGLQQAVEAFERVPIRRSTVHLASCSHRALLREYEHVSGMTGTTAGAEGELGELYGLSVVKLPPHRPLERQDEPDRPCADTADQIAAICADAERAHALGQPVLIGTRTENEARAISVALDRRSLSHQTLTSKDDAREAEIVARAGEPGAITVATRTAGRGTDIRLRDGGAGGLRVIGMGRAESRRVDDQLRGRAGRQGDPGSSVFYISKDDALLRRHAKGEERAALAKGGASPRRCTAIADAVQGRAEERAEGARRMRAAMEDVIDEQRRVFHTFRRDLLFGEPFHSPAAVGEPEREWLDRIPPIVERLRLEHARTRGGAFRPMAFRRELHRVFGIFLSASAISLDDVPSEVAARIGEGLLAQRERFFEAALRALAHLEAISDAAVAQRFGAPPPRGAPGAEASRPSPKEERREWAIAQVRRALRRQPPRLVLRHFQQAMLEALDAAWIDHLDALDQLRRDAFLESNASRRPPPELFRSKAKEAFDLTLGRASAHALWRVLVKEASDASSVRSIEARARRKTAFNEGPPARSRRDSSHRDGAKGAVGRGEHGE